MKPTAVLRYAKGFILSLLAIVPLIQFSLIHKSLPTEHIKYDSLVQWRKSYNQDEVGRDKMPDKSSPDKYEYTMWSKEEAFFHECKRSFLRNDTWGMIHAPYVDKVEAKNILTKLKVPGLRIIPTLAIFDKTNVSRYSLEFMQSLPQPYIIKATHVSGGVARVFNNTYHCFKYCNNARILPLDIDAFIASKKQLEEDINTDYTKLGGETQYKFIKPRIIFEEDIISGGKTETDVTFWWLTNGKPIFSSHQCGERKSNQQGFQMNRVFVSTNFRRLPIVFNRDTCADGMMPNKPKSWMTQLEVLSAIGTLFPGEVVRLDLYGGGEDVWFSEFTFTTAGCWRSFQPRVTDGLLYAIAHGQIPLASVDADYVERVLMNKSWVVVSFDDSGKIQPSFSGVYPSPVDMCEVLEGFVGKDEKSKREKIFRTCIREAGSIKGHPLHCIITQNNATTIASFAVLTHELLSDQKDQNDIDYCVWKYHQRNQDP